MTKMKKKKLTKAQIEMNARAKKELQAEGLLPPDKPRLNRKKFAEETISEFEAMDGFQAACRLREAASAMVCADSAHITPEQVGVLKCMKLAVEMEKFDKQLAQEGRHQYTLEEFFNQVYLPVIKL